MFLLLFICLFTYLFIFLVKANSVFLGPEFKLVFSIRPRSLTGILIHIGSQPGEHLCVYLEAGKVRSHLMTWEGYVSLYSNRIPFLETMVGEVVVESGIQSCI